MKMTDICDQNQKDLVLSFRKSGRIVGLQCLCQKLWAQRVYWEHRRNPEWCPLRCSCRFVLLFVWDMSFIDVNVYGPAAWIVKALRRHLRALNYLNYARIMPTLIGIIQSSMQVSHETLVFIIIILMDCVIMLWRNGDAQRFPSVLLRNLIFKK